MVGIIIAGAAFVAVETRVIDEIPGLESGIERLTGLVEQLAPAESADQDGIEELAPLPETDVAETADAGADEGVTETLVIDETAAACGRGCRLRSLNQLRREPMS